MSNFEAADMLDEPGPAQRRRNRQRRRIFAEAVKLFHENGGEDGGGHDKTTAEAIADRSDISVRSFFRYFQTKTDVIYVDIPSAMEDHVALTARLLGKMPPVKAILSASIIQLTEAISDPDDADRILRAMTSRHFIERRGMFSIVWRNRLAELIEPYVENSDEAARRLEAKVVAATGMQLRELALEEWAIAAGGNDLLKGFEGVIACFRKVIGDEALDRIDPLFDRRH